MGRAPEQRGRRGRNKGMCPKMEQMETSTVAESRPQVDDVVPSNSEMEEIIAVRIARTKESMVTE